ncbi:hypothetical protein GPECTOR_20g457 [Gonium pectorale]|uniref:Uncharacterized protein n=1 Tax=Gonium pectorale TaxID=33097 RepID=A0A150GIG1_GONPE|nr:hypothetical protein GPECTOR_20g457 [Gonium pectorale]|eukprot:KXZ49601.1 hypothetical protein GPECTOR_20g457 [Gonium pectorale]
MRREDVAAVVKREAGPDEVAGLLSYVARMPEDELAALSLLKRMPIIDFVRLASGAVGAAGPGPGPGSTGATGTGELCSAATRMVAALVGIQAPPEPGEQLSLEAAAAAGGVGASFLFHPFCASLYVRSCYPLLFSALVRHPRPRKYIGEQLGDALALLAAGSA